MRQRAYPVRHPIVLPRLRSTDTVNDNDPMNLADNRVHRATNDPTGHNMLTRIRGSWSSAHNHTMLELQEQKTDAHKLSVGTFCGARGIRTPDLFHAMEARYQLRHSPVI